MISSGKIKNKLTKMEEIIKYLKEHIELCSELENMQSEKKVLQLVLKKVEKVAINYTRCSLQLKDKKTVTFEDWLYKHQIKKIDRLYFAKDGTEQDFNALHRRYVESLINL